MRRNVFLQVDVHCSTVRPNVVRDMLCVHIHGHRFLVLAVTMLITGFCTYVLRKLNFLCNLFVTDSDNPVIAEGYWHFKLSNYYLNLLTVHEIAACDKLRRNVICKRVHDAFTAVCLSRV